MTVRAASWPEDGSGIARIDTSYASDRVFLVTSDGHGFALHEETAAVPVVRRCLWLETQNVNYPAVQFYRRVGFRLCGLDDRLYDPEQNPGEVALFFALDL